MDIASIIVSAAKSVGVSGQLLLALCMHESGGFKYNFSAMDGGSPSFGSCQIKYATAVQLGFHGHSKELMNPKINALYAAKYLKYQQDRYGDDWLLLAAAYNSGTYNPSNVVRGCPRNLEYVKKIKQKLPEEFRYKLDCGHKRYLYD